MRTGTIHRNSVEGVAQRHKWRRHGSYATERNPHQENSSTLLDRAALGPRYKPPINITVRSALTARELPLASMVGGRDGDCPNRLTMRIRLAYLSDSRGDERPVRLHLNSKGIVFVRLRLARGAGPQHRVNLPSRRNGRVPNWPAGPIFFSVQFSGPLQGIRRHTAFADTPHEPEPIDGSCGWRGNREGAIRSLARHSRAFQ